MLNHNADACLHIHQIRKSIAVNLYRVLVPTELDLNLELAGILKMNHLRAYVEIIFFFLHQLVWPTHIDRSHHLDRKESYANGIEKKNFLSQTFSLPPNLSPVPEFCFLTKKPWKPLICFLNFTTRVSSPGPWKPCHQWRLALDSANSD